MNLPTEFLPRDGRLEQIRLRSIVDRKAVMGGRFSRESKMTGRKMN